MKTIKFYALAVVYFLAWASMMPIALLSGRDHKFILIIKGWSKGKR